jgi:hypothetical protein
VEYPSRLPRSISPPAPLTVGESILPYDALSISLGASWTYGLYSDKANRTWYVCDKHIVVAVFPEEQMREATLEYGRRRTSEESGVPPDSLRMSQPPSTLPGSVGIEPSPGELRGSAQDGKA